jgi:cell division protein FtsZ
VVHDAVGDDAEIIFGAVNEPAMQGEIRVTVIATGFDRVVQGSHAPTQSEPVQPARNTLATPVIPFPAQRPPRLNTVASRSAQPSEHARRPIQPPSGLPDKSSQDLNDMEIPTFIRRQMD